MYKQCKTIPSGKRQQHIVQSLLTLMKKQNFAKIPISDICRSAGISRNVFYRYFETKEDIILFLSDTLLSEFDRFTLEYPVPVDEDHYVRWKLEVFFSFWYEKKDILKALIDNNLTNILFQRMMIKNRETSGEAAMLPTDSSEEPMPLYLIFSIYGMAALLLNWHEQNYVPDSVKMAENSLHLFVEPLFRRSGR